MKLAFAEILRSQGRYLPVVVALALIVFLVLVLAALSDGLYFQATGAVRNTGGDLLVFSEDGQRSLIRSQLDEADGERVAAVDGVAEVGSVGTVLGAGAGPRGALDLAVFGFRPSLPGGPSQVVEGRLPDDGPVREAVADVTLRQQGVEIGDTVLFSGSDAPLRIVGFAEDVSYQLQPTVWTSVDTWRTVRDQARPELAGEEATVQAFSVRLDEGADPEQVANRIDEALGGTTETVTTQTAILSIPGVDQQRSTLNAIIGTSFGVAGLVIALFFALLTLEKRNLLAMLKALGASSTYLAGGVLAQAMVANVAGLLLGGALAWLLSLVLPDAIPALFRTQTTVVLVIATLVTGALGAALSFRRVTRIDPASALGGTL
jgi:putative ABC transport system permease protein